MSPYILDYFSEPNDVVHNCKINDESVIAYFRFGAVHPAVEFYLIKPEVRQYRNGSILTGEKTCL